jgi:lipopolysaccharide exporter
MTRAKSRNLPERVRRGAVLSIANAVLIRLSGILITAIVAHILDPRDFGAYAVALSAYAIVTAIGQVGVASCLIRADLDIDALAPTMVTVALAGCAILAAAMAAFARPIATALGSAYATGPVRVTALAVLLSGAFAVPGAQLARDFKQDKLLLANVISFVPCNAALLILARSGSGAMAFAWSRVIGELIVGSVYVASAPKIFRPGLARDALSVLYRFGVPFAAANFVNYILLNVDNVLVGHLLGAAKLGTYVLAFNVASWPYTLLGAAISTVAIPAFSRVKHDAALFRTAITGSLRDLSLVVMPICGVLMAVATPLVLTLYGAQWAASAQVLTVLAVYSAISMACVLFASILGSLGRTRSLLAIQLIWLGALIPAMALGVHRDGLVGAAFAHLAVIGPVVLPCYLLALARATGVGSGALAKAVRPALLASSVAALAARFAAAQFGHPLAQLAAGLAVGGLTYAVTVAPQAVTLLNRGKVTGPRMRRVLRLYSVAARLAGLPSSHPPKHAAKSRPRGRAIHKAPGPAVPHHCLDDDRTAPAPAGPGGWRAAERPAPYHGGPGPAARGYTRIVIFTLAGDQAAHFDRLAAAAAKEVGAKEPGTLMHAVHHVPNSPLQRVFYEIYRDRAAFDAHENQPYMKRFAAERRSCVVATRVIELRQMSANFTNARVLPLLNQRGAQLPVSEWPVT